MSSVSAERSNSAVSGDKTSATFPLGLGTAMEGYGMGTLTRIFQGWGHANFDGSHSGSWCAESDVELELWTFQGAMHVLLTQYLGDSQSQLDLALAAYDAGLADGFYGVESAIAKGLAAKFDSMIQGAESEAGAQIRWDLLEMIRVSARGHAKNIRGWHQAVRTSSGNKIAPVLRPGPNIRRG